MLRHRIILFIKLSVACGLIAWLAASGKIDLEELAKVGERWPWVLAAQVPFGLVMLLAAFRWRLLLRAQGIHYTFSDTFSLTMIGQLFNQLVIGSTGGDMVKAYAVAMEQPGRRGPGILSVFLDRAVGLLVLVFFALIAGLFNLDLILSSHELISLAILIGSILLASLALGGLFYSERVRSFGILTRGFSKLPFQRALGRISDAIYVYKFHPREVLLALFSSLLVHASVVTMNILLARALIPGPLPWTSFFFLVPIAQIAMAIPINPPGAIGTAEGIYQFLFVFAEVRQGAMICLLQRFTYYLWAALGFVYYVRRKRRVAGAVKAALSDDSKALYGDSPPPPGGGVRNGPSRNLGGAPNEHVRSGKSDGSR